MEVNIPTPNPAVAEVLVGPEVRRIMEERADMAALMLQARIAKRTGTLARSIRSHVEMGGKKNDRWIGGMGAGDDRGRAGAYYGASHEFGTGDKPGSRSGSEVVEGAHDLNFILEELGSM